MGTTAGKIGNQEDDLQNGMEDTNQNIEELYGMDISQREHAGSTESMYHHEVNGQIEKQETLRESVTTQGPTDDGDVGDGNISSNLVGTDDGNMNNIENIGPISSAARKEFDGQDVPALPEDVVTQDDVMDV